MAPLSLDDDFGVESHGAQAIEMVVADDAVDQLSIPEISELTIAETPPVTVFRRLQKLILHRKVNRSCRRSRKRR
ncbi:MAG: hypothetical protein IPO00_16490 [Betaproteobacteria bacterium]|nr:hypothetical protein [Betaproteobacteria bacterium]